MNKIYTILLILVICLSMVTLTACGSKSADTNTSENTVTTSSTDSITEETPDENSSEAVTNENATDINEEDEETAPDYTGDVIDFEADAQAVYDYAFNSLMPEGDVYHFEILENIAGEDGKSCVIVYSVEDDIIINYYKATLELDADGNWLVKENEFTHNQEK